VLHILGHEERPARNIVIAGAGNIGKYVAERLLREQGKAHLTIVERERERAEAIALELGELGSPIVLHGSALDAEVLDEAEIAQADLFIALTNDDKVNLLSSLLARQKGVARAMSLVSTLDSAALAAPLGVDSWIDPRAVTVSTILQYARGGYLRRIYPVYDDGGEIIEAEVLETAPIAGRKLREAEIPEGVRIGLVVRGEELIRPGGDVELKPGDDVILFALADQREEVAKLFRVSLGYY
jgi:trk system potassium uptake protein TrkA